MKFYPSIFYFFVQIQNITTSTSKYIKNGDFPSCKNCVHFRPNLFIGDYTMGKCANFGTKDIFDNTITYDYVDNCRDNANKCGNEGKYYQIDKNADMKLFLYTLFQNVPNISIISTILILYYNIGRNK